MAAVVVIPARYGSTRFTAKIVASDTGKPLVQHVVDRVRQCVLVSDVIVATDDARIVDALRPFETRTMMTSSAHPSGTDRVAEVARGLTADIIVNVQGDEPEIEPGTIDGLIEHLQNHPQTPMATAATSLPPGADVNDPNLVKVAMNQAGRAVYFSRSPIPFHRDSASGALPVYHLHLGIYAYQRKALLDFAVLPPGNLESIEKLEQLRAIEHSWPIHVMIVDRATHGIDTLEQYSCFVKRFREVGGG